MYLPTYESFIYTLDMAFNTYNKFEQLWQGTHQVMHTILKAEKHPIIHSTIQQDKGGIVEKINDANSHQHSAATEQDNIPREAEDNPIKFSGPKQLK